MAHLFNKGIYYIENGTNPNTLGLVPTQNVGLAKTEDGSLTWRYDDALPTNKWVLDNLDRYNAHIVATTTYDPLNPLAGWVAPSNPIQGNTVEVKFTDGTIGNYTFDGTAWGLDFIDDTATAQRPWIKEGNTTETSATDVLSTDNIYHDGKVIIGQTETIIPHQFFYDAQIDNGLRVHGPTRNTYDNYSTDVVSLNVNPITGNDSLEPREYVDNGGVFKTLSAAITYVNNSSFTSRNIITVTGTTVSTPISFGNITLNRGRAININANGEFIQITGIVSNFGIMTLNWGTYAFTGNFQFRNFYNSGFYAFTTTFNLSSANTTAHFLFRVGASGVFDSNIINYNANNSALVAMETNVSINLFNSNFQTNGFTGSKLARGIFQTYSQANTVNITGATWSSLNSQAIDVTDCTILHDNRYYHGFITLPPLASVTNQNLNVYAGNFKIYDVLKFDNNAAATVDVGVVWATSATNTLSLPEGVLMVKY